MKNSLLLTALLFFIFLGTSFAQQAQTNIQEPDGVSELVQLKAKMSQKSLFGNRYNIQLGAFSSLATANKVKDNFTEDYPEWPIRIQYESPSYKVWVGNFVSRLAAERLFLKLKKEYKSAIVFRLNS